MKNEQRDQTRINIIKSPCHFCKASQREKYLRNWNIIDNDETCYEIVFYINKTRTNAVFISSLLTINIFIHRHFISKGLPIIKMTQQKILIFTMSINSSLLQA